MLIDFIPPMAVAIPFLYDAYLWLLFRRRRLRVNIRSYLIFSFCFFLQGILYIVFSALDVPLEVHNGWVRLSLLNIALSFAIPMTFQYMQDIGDGLE